MRKGCAGRLANRTFTSISSTTLTGFVFCIYFRKLPTIFVNSLDVFGICANSAFEEMEMIFPSASERRVLPIVGVCKTSSHLLIFTSSHLHIFSSSHLLLIFSSSPHLLIFSSSSSSHLLLIFSSSHLLIFTSHIFSHLLTSSHIFSHLLSHLLLLPSCPLALSFFSISLLKAGAGAVPTRQHETQPFRTK